jgi:hypothetical protein
MSYGMKGVSMAECPVCKTVLSPEQVKYNENAQFPGLCIQCPRCGYFTLIERALNIMINEGDKERHRRAITSHAIRRMQRSGEDPPALFPDQLTAIWQENRLPKPQRQCDLFILLLGGLQPSWSEPVKISRLGLDAEIGAAITPLGQPSGSEWIGGHLRSLSLVTCNLPVVGEINASLTLKGWSRYEELLRQSGDSRTAFMAMKFGKPRSDAMYRDHFIPAVKATGFELQRLDTRPKAGLIDARMEVEIRTARFLVADLTHGNRGAYWEAGFAAGLGTPVFYTCEEGYFSRYSTHFDTNHHYIVMWNAAKPDDAVEALKATIRATLPAEANLRDD